MLQYEKFIKWFAQKCDEHGKLFIPDSPRQEKVAKNLIAFHNKYYNFDILRIAAEAYIKNCTESVLIFDFALVAHEYRKEAVGALKSKQQFNEILEQTKQRHLDRLANES